MLNPHDKLTPTNARVIGVASIIAVFVLWTVMSSVLGDQKLPSPLKVVKAFAYLGFETTLLWDASLASAARIGSAALLVLVIGIPIGVAMGASPILNAALSPLIDPFRSAPIVATLPIFVMLIGIDETMKVMFLFTGAVIYLIPLVRDAMISVPYSYWESMKDLGATNVECITKGVLKLAAPRIFDSVIVSTSILWTYITVAEYVNAGAGLGQLIQNARRFSAMDQVLAGIITIVVFALLTHTLLVALRNRLYPWESKQ